MVEYNFAKLTGRIIEKFGTRERFAEAVGWNPRSLSDRLSNRTAFRPNDVEKCLSVLGIDRTDIHEYFFDVKPRKTEQNVSGGAQ